MSLSMKSKDKTGACRPQLLSTTSYPYAKILARQIRANDSTVKLAFGGVFATLNAGLVKLNVRSRFRMSR
jgi:hypothetical protein